jgi:hypothetical protein
MRVVSDGVKAAWKSFEYDVNDPIASFRKVKIYHSHHRELLRSTSGDTVFGEEHPISLHL